MKNISAKIYSVVFGSFLTLVLTLIPSSAFAVGAPIINTSPSVSSVTQTSVVLSGTFNDNGSPVSTSFEYGPNLGLGLYTMTTDQTASSGSMSEPLSGLQANTTYYFRAVGVNGVAFSHGTIYNFKTLPVAQQIQQLTVTTNNASSVADTSAMLNGYVNPNGATASRWFEYGTNSSSLNTSTSSQNQPSAGAWNASLSGLTANTTYYFRACAQNANTPSTCDTTRSFTTTNFQQQQNTPPTIVANTAVMVSGTSFILNGYVYTNSNTNINTTTWFEYGTNSNSFSGSTPYVTIFTSSPISYTVNNLNPNTNYYFRACAQNANSSGPVCSTSTQSFYTGTNNNNNQTAPSVSTISTTSVGQTDATLNGWFNANSSNSNTSTRFAYGTNSNNLFSYTNYVNQGSSSGNFVQYISGLQANTTYYARAEAYNSFGSATGSIISFTTGGSNQNSSNVIISNTQSTSVTRTTASVSSQVTNFSNYNISARFEYGTTISLGRTATFQSVGFGSTIVVRDTLTGLSANTIYYYRLVAQGNFGTVYGDIQILKTLPNPVVITNPTTPTPVVVVSTSSKNLVMNLTSSSGNVSVGNTVRYSLSYQNNSGLDLSNAILKITLPRQMIFRGASIGTYSEASSMIVANVGMIPKGSQGFASFDAEVGTNANIGDILVTTAEMVYTKPNGDQENSLAYAANTVETNSLSQTASSIFGNINFLPTSLLGWLLLALIILALVYFGRKLATKEKAPEVHGHN